MKEEIITIKIDHEPKQVKKSDYIRLKTKDLNEFGYEVTEEKVSESVARVINKKLPKDVIDYFIKADIVL